MTATANEDPPRGTEPLAERLISDVDTLRAISDPLRLRILEVMTAGHDETFTVKRLATTIGANPTKLYHHVNLLVERDLIAVAGQRVVSGIIETSYRVGQLSLRLDRALLASEASVTHDTLATLFDGARDEIERGLAAGVVSTSDGAPPETKLILARGIGRMEPAAAVAFQARLAALFEEFGATAVTPEDSPEGSPEADERLAFGLVVAMYPLLHPTDAEPDADEETDR